MLGDFKEATICSCSIFGSSDCTFMRITDGAAGVGEGRPELETGKNFRENFPLTPLRQHFLDRSQHFHPFPFCISTRFSVALLFLAEGG